MASGHGGADPARVPHHIVISIQDPQLPDADRERYSALTASVRDAERAAGEADIARLEAFREFQRCCFAAGLARAAHRNRAAEADHAKDSATEARERWRQTMASAYREWKTGHPGARDHEQLLTELASACGMMPRDFLRRIGYRLDRRTPSERDEDLLRYKNGESLSAIARSRGIHRMSVQKHVRRHLMEEAMAGLESTCTLDDLHGEGGALLRTARAPAPSQYEPGRPVGDTLRSPVPSDDPQRS